VYGKQGILHTGEHLGHDPRRLSQSLRFVRTAVVDPDSAQLFGLQGEQVAWLRACRTQLNELAGQLRVGRSLLLGSVPLDPVLQWREQVISDNDVLLRRIANNATRAAFEHLAEQIVDDSAWEPL